jgi:hypothetical protein
MENKLKLYQAIIWLQNQDAVGLRVELLAENLANARKKLEAKHGKGNVYNLHNKEDADNPR